MHDELVMRERLELFLADVEPRARRVSVTNYEPIVGGYSRVMARFDVQWELDGKAETVKLVFRGDPPADRAGFHTDRRTEWDLLARLNASDEVGVPPVRYFCEGGVLGTPSIVMDFVPSRSLLAELAAREVETADAIKLAGVAAGLHRVPLDSLPASLIRPADWNGYLTSRIATWAETERAHPESDPFMRYIGAWLDAHRPPPVPLTLVHGDFQSANVLVRPDGEWAVVDWEFARIGDPREDLGYFRAVAGAAPPDPVAADEVGFCARYRELTGLSEAQLNPAVIGYFTILGAISILAQILEQKAAAARGELHSMMGYYVTNAVTFAHGVQLNVSGVLEAAMAEMEKAAC